MVVMKQIQLMISCVVLAEDVLIKINKYLPVIEELASVEIGTTLVDLSSDCFCQECNLGNFICDAYMNQVSNIGGPFGFCYLSCSKRSSERRCWKRSVSWTLNTVTLKVA